MIYKYICVREGRKKKRKNERWDGVYLEVSIAILVVFEERVLGPATLFRACITFVFLFFVVLAGVSSIFLF